MEVIRLLRSALDTHSSQRMSLI
ncbi:hypothetical protein E2C01_066476 [Portunus trituberculatus]|uniref:Uncharacterized protein n=1 Tax=Portunus trituberculatus TaxID=210409 RepID=A0A5B7HH69_PORTR|nr:hypothetical protein [Portunus trituberculatus]